MLTKRYGFLVRTQTGAGPISLRRGLWCPQRCGYQVCTQNQLEAQRSGFELERRSKGEKRSFKAAPKGTALKRSGAVSLRRGAADGSRTRTPVRTQAPQACQSTNSSTAAERDRSKSLLILYCPWRDLSTGFFNSGAKIYFCSKRRFPILKHRRSGAMIIAAWTMNFDRKERGQNEKAN